ncbi:MAG: thioesterase [Bacteroidota bacterium]|jgi:medium-chain acyl-[acyl-carrier-protein] hydrolase|nr:thioesterase [Bacteroidota bacterium]
MQTTEWNDGGNIFRHTYFAQYHDCDTRQRLTVLAMMRYFEDIALLQSESYDVGLRYYESQRVAWLLNKWDIRIHDTPVFMDDVHVHTQPTAMRRFLANRRYRIVGDDGAARVDADSQWVFVDMARRRPTRIREEIFRTYGIIQESETLPAPAGIEVPLRVDVTREFHIRKSDIDVNRHVNNIRYVDWAFDALPDTVALEGSLTRLRVHYRKEVHDGEEVRVRGELREEGDRVVAVHGVYVGEDLRCSLESQWTMG